MNILQTIQTAVGEQVARSYSGYVNQAADALTAREEEIKRRLTRVATDHGLSTADARRILDEVGLNDGVLTDAAASAHQSSSALVELAAKLNEDVAELNRQIQNL